MRRYYSFFMIVVLLFVTSNLNCQLLNKDGKKMVSKITFYDYFDYKTDSKRVITIKCAYNSNYELVVVDYSYIHPNPVIELERKIYIKNGKKVTCKYYKDNKPYNRFDYEFMINVNNRISYFLEYEHCTESYLSRKEYKISYKNGVFSQFMRHTSGKRENFEWEHMPDWEGYEFFVKNGNFNFRKKIISYDSGEARDYHKMTDTIFYTANPNDINFGVEYMINKKFMSDALCNPTVLFTEWVGLCSKNTVDYVKLNNCLFDKYIYTYDRNNNIISIDVYEEFYPPKGKARKKLLKHVEIEYIYD